MGGALEGRRWPSWAPAASIVALALAASAASLANGFAYDDLPIIVENARVHDVHRIGALFGQSYWPPAHGAALYRPLTTAVFALLWAGGGGSPRPFHGLNVLVYVAVCVVVYALARRVLSAGPAWFAAALYAVHPVHVEVVANCVGLSELLAALAVAGAVALFLRARANGALSPRHMAAIGLLYAAGCLAKEHAIVLPVLLLAAEGTVVADGRPWRDRIAEWRPFALVLTAVAVGYLAARVACLGGLVGETPAPTLGSTPRWTMLGVVTEWVRLLVWPAHLAALYAPPATGVHDGPDAVTLTGAAVLVATLALAVAARRRAPALSFGLLWVGIALAPVSNMIVRTGVLLAERTLFMPSIGVALALAGLASLVTVRTPTVGLTRATVAVMLVLAIWRSATRAGAWHDNETAFRTAVADEPMSYLAHFAYAGLLFSSGHAVAGEREGKAAIGLYPDDGRPQAALAGEYARVGHCDQAMILARSALTRTPPPPQARLVLASCLYAAGRFDAGRPVALAGIASGYQVARFRQLLHSAP